MPQTQGPSHRANLYHPTQAHLKVAMLLLLSTVLLFTAERGFTSPNEPSLTQQEANARSQLIALPKQSTGELAPVLTHLKLKIPANGSHFTGRAIVRAHFLGVPASQSELFIDLWSAARVTLLKINGTELRSFRHQSDRLYLPGERLSEGWNKIEINYVMPFSDHARGLRKFTDPLDNRVYLYSQFEPFDAHRVFPCFDQPDLKTRLTLIVTAPKGWTVISTMPPVQHPGTSSDTKEWTFQQTPPLSPYTLSLHAGPYQVWQTSFKNLPLRLYARKSISQSIEPDIFFRSAAHALGFFEDYFAQPYPFKKYDQVIVPEFDTPAMENAGAVTFSEDEVIAKTDTREGQEKLSELIHHEAAHMWLGNLVTMRWWDDLWLNESFATYLAFLANSELFNESWEQFQIREKGPAYQADQLRKTSHPVAGPVPDTDSAMANFDELTYGKGAALIKQLIFLMGEDRFREAVRSFINTHAYSSVTFHDLLQTLARHTSLDIDSWAAASFKANGTDHLTATPVCKDSGNGKVLDRIELKFQTANGQASQRPHRTQISLYRFEAGVLSPYHVFTEVHGAREREPHQFPATLPCPDFVYPNTGDYDFVQVELDPQSLRSITQARAEMRGEDAALTKAMIWQNLFAQVRAAKLSPKIFLETAANSILSAPNSTLSALISYLPQVLYYASQASDFGKRQRDNALLAVEENLWLRFQRSKAKSDSQTASLSAFLQVASSSQAQSRLRNILRLGKNDDLPNEQRWAVVIRLSALGTPQSDDLIQEELKRGSQNSEKDLARTHALAARASRPSLAEKRTLMNRLTVSRDDSSYWDRWTIIENLFPRNQDQLRENLAADFFSGLTPFVKKNDLNLATLYASSLVPATCNEHSLIRLKNYVSSSRGQLPAPIMKALLVSEQEDEICVNVRKRMRGAGA